MPENLAVTLACTDRTDSQKRGKKLSRVGMKVPDMYAAFRIGTKLTVLRATKELLE